MSLDECILSNYVGMERNCLRNVLRLEETSEEDVILDVIKHSPYIVNDIERFPSL